MNDRPPLPTFLIIGAQKAGTRWLAANLRKHPEVFVADGEPSFFQYWERMRDVGLDGYRRHFVGWSGERAVGESTPAYLMYHFDPEATADRIVQWLPNVRVLAILRDPVERAQSALLHQIERGRLAPGTRLVDLVRRHPPGPHELHRPNMAWGGPEALISAGWYGANLAPYVRKFGRRLHVILHDEIVRDPTTVYREVSAHVGVDRTFVPADLGEVLFSNRGGEDTILSGEDRLQLAPWFAADLDLLEALIDCDLSSWR